MEGGYIGVEPSRAVSTCTERAYIWEGSREEGRKEEGREEGKRKGDREEGTEGGWEERSKLFCMHAKQCLNTI